MPSKTAAERPHAETYAVLPFSTQTAPLHAAPETHGTVQMPQRHVPLPQSLLEPQCPSQFVSLPS
jgi:hypothetical protein